MKSCIQAAKELIERLLPGYGDRFIVEQIPKENGLDVWELDAQNGVPVLRGSSPVEIGCALSEYLENTLQACLSHCGSRIPLPDALPAPKARVRRVIAQQRRAYMNYCTISYSAAWWGWAEWEHEIDMMAVKGINMPLTVIGTETVWYYTLLDMGYTDEQARAFICGPAYMAWFLMANLQSYGGPVLRERLDRRLELGREIIERELELGMMPIQHGFAGVVPNDLGEHYPEAGVGVKPDWCAFPGAAQLDPTDPLFERMAGVYYRNLEKLMGAHHYYALDPFHESEPPVNTPEYLQAAGAAIAEPLRAFDPKAEAVMQSWSIRRDVLEGMGDIPVLILDYNDGCERNDGWWGRPFLLGNLHNFGGRINLHGDLPMIASNRFVEMHEKYPNLCGTGLFMEGIGQNPLYYDLAFSTLTRQQPVELDAWLENYAVRRWGDTENARKAARAFAAAVYRPGTNGVESSSMFAARPAVDCKKSGPNAGFFLPYEQAELADALRLLVADAEALSSSDGYLYDLTDICRQLLSNRAQLLQKKWAAEYLAGDYEAFERDANDFLTLFEEADTLLYARQEFSFDRWLDMAEAADPEPEQKRQNLRNAATLLTIWGPDEPIIFDYAWREWSGLIGRFYLPRWQMFIDMLREKIACGETWSEEGLLQVHGRETFRANEFYSRMADFELAFAYGEGIRGEKKTCDIVETARRLLAKYGDFSV